MPALSNYAESGLLNFLFRSNSNAFGRPDGLYVALCRNVPSESDTGTTIPEVANAGSYARVAMGAPTNSVFSEVAQDASSSGTIANLAAVTFPTATADWGYVSGMAILNSGVHGTGQVLLFGALPVPRIILNNDQYNFPISNITILLG